MKDILKQIVDLVEKHPKKAIAIAIIITGTFAPQLKPMVEQIEDVLLGGSISGEVGK